jgi:hypothetical protein
MCLIKCRKAIESIPARIAIFARLAVMIGAECVLAQKTATVRNQLKNSSNYKSWFAPGSP